MIGGRTSIAAFGLADERVVSSRYKIVNYQKCAIIKHHFYNKVRI